MTKKDLFRVLIKIFGLYSIILSLFTILPASISSFAFGFDTSILLIVVGSLLVVIGLFLLLLFKSDYIINLLGLDKGFDDEQVLLGNLNNESVLKLAIIIIGGFLIIENIPGLLFDLINAFKYKATFTTIEGSKLNYFGITTGIINLLIGYLLLNNYKWLAAFFNKAKS